MEQFTVIGIDPGLKTTGLAVVRFERNRIPKLAHYEHIKTTGEKGLAGRKKLLSDRERTDWISAEMVARLVEYDPNAVSIEDFVFMGNRGRAEAQTVRLVESLKVNSENQGYSTAVYDNAYWKDVLMKCRTADKAQVRHYVCRLLGMSEAEWEKADRGGHLLDAAALALAHTKLMHLKGVNVPWHVPSIRS